MFICLHKSAGLLTPQGASVPAHGVDHGGAHILMAQQILIVRNVLAPFQKVLAKEWRKGMAILASFCSRQALAPPVFTARCIHGGVRCVFPGPCLCDPASVSVWGNTHLPGPAAKIPWLQPPNLLIDAAEDQPSGSGAANVSRSSRSLPVPEREQFHDARIQDLFTRNSAPPSSRRPLGPYNRTATQCRHPFCRFDATAFHLPSLSTPWECSFSHSALQRPP